LHLPKIAEYGVSLIFFFYGLKLDPRSLVIGLSNWKLDLLVQFSTFLLFPLTVLTMKWFSPVYFSTLLGLGIFYLAALPSTVSSSVVLVSIAGGNLPSAIFNASISSIIGIFITPVWMSGMLQKAMGELMLIFFLIVFRLMDLLSVWLSFNRADRITVILCGSKKSLVQGAVMGKAMFPSQAMLDVVLLPLMLYHALQLLAGSTIANAMGSKIKEKSAI
jgi:predicted Na+-dependent transporter